MNDVHVVPRDSLDGGHDILFSKSWLVVYPDGRVEEFDTEDAACAYQRVYRLVFGLDPMTGEPR